MILASILAVATSIAHADESQLLLITGSGVRLRAAPNANSAVLMKIPVGTIVECRARSAEVEVDGKRGGFGQVRAGDLLGWVFLPFTEPVDADREAQLRRLIEKKLKELDVVHDGLRTADVYELHRFLLRRIETATEGPLKMRARLDELRLLRNNAMVFRGDKRIYRDEAQGFRLRRESIEALVADAKGTPVAEEAAWLLVQHGHDFECEGYAPCLLQSLSRIECVYLKRFPDGPHVVETMKRLTETLNWMRDDLQTEPAQPLDDASERLKEVGACLSQTQRPEANDARKAFETLAAMLGKRPPARAP